MDIKRALRNAVSTGKVYLGTSQTKKSVGKGKAKLVIASKNCPKDELAFVQEKAVPVFMFDGTNTELGAACGKPFTVSMISIQAAGDSDILALRKEIQSKKSTGKKVVKKKST